jgi:mannan polymerase II complex ANP1 subunit
MNRHTASSHGFAAHKRYDDDDYRSNGLDMESKYIYDLPDLLEDEKNDHDYRSFEPRKKTLYSRNRLVKTIAPTIIGFFFLLYLLFPSTRRLVGLGGAGDSDAGKIYEIETVRYYDLENVQGTSVGWEREERVLLCTPLRDASAHLPMFFGHLRNFTYPHKLVDLAFLVSDSKDDTEDALNKQLEALQNDPTPGIPFGEISVIHKDFGQAVSQDAESRHGFAVQASRRKLMAQARNWLLSAALRPYHSWVYWRDADVETCPFTIIEDLMRHDKDVIVPSK